MKLKKLPLLVLAYALIAFVCLYFLESNKDIIYPIKALVKSVLFVLIPVVALMCTDKKALGFLKAKNVPLSSWKWSIIIGLIMIGVVQGVYFLLQGVIDLDSIAWQLEQDVGVNKEIFVYIGLYITFGNSFIEEFFFRGILLVWLAQFWSWRWVSVLSAFLFAGYHVSIFAGWFDWKLTLLSLLGLFIGGVFFNALNKKSRTLYPGWIAHICGDVAVILVGFKMFGFF